jgi:hypothetical protein
MATRARIDGWLGEFALHEQLASHVAEVFGALPPAVRDDLMNDPAFVIWDYEPGPGVVMHVPVRMPAGRGGAGRSVVLKRTMLLRPVGFVRWVIAHELAHAHLRNAGRWEGDDPEHAADALAAGWGFPKPPREQW